MKQSNIKEQKIFIVETVGISILLLLVIVLTGILSLKKKYTVTFDSMGGTHTTSARVLMNAKLKEPKTPTKSGYTFLGWYYRDAKFSFDENITSNMNLVAHWEKEEKKEIVSIEGIIKAIQKGQTIVVKKIPRKVQSSDYK